MMETDYHLGANDGCKSPSWRERFVSYLDNSQSMVSVMVQMGVEQGLADDSIEGRRLLAHDLGSVLDSVYVEETGGELYIDDLTPDEIQERTRILQDRQQGLIEIMVEAGMVKSRQDEVRRRRVNGR